MRDLGAVIDSWILPKDEPVPESLTWNFFCCNVNRFPYVVTQNTSSYARSFHFPNKDFDLYGMSECLWYDLIDVSHNSDSEEIMVTQHLPMLETYPSLKAMRSQAHILYKLRWGK